MLRESSLLAFSLPQLARAVLLATLAGAVLAAPEPAGYAQEKATPDDVRKELEESKRRLESVRTKEKELAGDLDKLARERADLNKKLIKTASRVQESEAKLSEIEDRLAKLTEQEKETRASIAERHEAIAKMLGAMQRIGRQPPPPLVTQRDDALKMVRSAMLMASVFPELKFQADGLKAELEDLVRLGRSIKRQRDNLKAEKEKLVAAQTRINDLLEKKKAQVQLRQSELKKIREAAARNAETVDYLDELVKRMDKEVAEAGLAAYEAELAAKKKAEAEQNVFELKPSETRKVALMSPGRIKPAVPFPETKGKLSMPVHGERIRAFGEKDKYGETAEGISLATRPGARVTSPADGWVVYADTFRTYGQLLIINAGGGYHILLAGMTRIDVDVGQFVLAGEPVALMGSTAPGNGQQNDTARPVLYVEFRNNGRPIDPGPWWAKSPERVQG